MVAMPYDELWRLFAISVVCTLALFKTLFKPPPKERFRADRNRRR